MDRHRRTSLVVAAAGLALLSTGCDTLPKRNEPGINYGQIYVGSPRIEGRERLINDRGEQERWLRERLAKLDDAPLNVSGAVEMNSLAITAAQLGISVDPAFKTNALNRDREAAGIRQSADNERAANTLQAVRRDEILAKVNKGEMNFDQAKAEFDKIGIAMPASAPTTAKTPADAASVAGRSVNNTALGANSSKVDPPKADPRRADLTSTSIEEFRQRLADREVVRNEINDIRLDDLHDLNGNTLYRLTFDTTVLPQDDASAWAIVKVRVPVNVVNVPALRDTAETQFLRSLRDSSEAAYRGIANRLADECYAREAEAVKTSKMQQDQARALEENARKLAEKAWELRGNAKTKEEYAKIREAEVRAQEALEAARLAFVKSLDGRVTIFRRAFGCGSFYVGSNARRIIERHLAAWYPDFSQADGYYRKLKEQLDDESLEPGKAEEYRRKLKQLFGEHAQNANPADEYRRNLMLQLDGKHLSTATADERELKRRTLGDWATWLGQVMDSQIFEDFEGHVLKCFDELFINGRGYAGSSFPLDLETAGRRVNLGQAEGIFRFQLVDRGATPMGMTERCGQIDKTRYDPTNTRFEALLKQNLVAAVYAATPKESVQTISETASNRQARELLFNLNAVTGTAGIAAGLNMIRTNDVFIHALRRQPLVVGFTQQGRIAAADQADAGKELVFGWVLGPTYKLSDDGKRTFFRHSVAQRAVSAELSLPAWMSLVKVTVETSWLREDGSPGRTPGSSPDGTAMASSSRIFTVPLPAQPAEVLSAIDERYQREPKVDVYQELRVVEDKPARVLITGRNLWRSTDVLIGSQRASQLAVLSDNRGVLATFDKIEAPLGAAPLDGRNDLVRLSLMTSEGSVIAGQVVIAPKEGTAKPAEAPKAIDGVTTRIVAGLDSKLVLPEALPAANDATVRLGSSKSVKLSLLLDKTTLLNEDRKTLIFSVARDKISELLNGDPVRAVLVLSKANGAVELLDLVKDGIFYDSEDKTKAGLSAKRDGPKKPIQMTLKLPAKATQGFAGLAKGVANAELTVRFGDKVDEKASLVATCRVKNDTCTMSFDAPDAIKARLADKKDTDITVTASLQGKDVPEVTPKELKLK